MLSSTKGHSREALPRKTEQPKPNTEEVTGLTSKPATYAAVVKTAKSPKSQGLKAGSKKTAERRRRRNAKKAVNSTKSSPPIFRKRPAFSKGANVEWNSYLDYVENLSRFTVFMDTMKLPNVMKYNVCKEFEQNLSVHHFKSSDGGATLPKHTEVPPESDIQHISEVAVSQLEISTDVPESIESQDKSEVLSAFDVDEKVEHGTTISSSELKSLLGQGGDLNPQSNETDGGTRTSDRSPVAPKKVYNDLSSMLDAYIEHISKANNLGVFTHEKEGLIGAYCTRCKSLLYEHDKVYHPSKSNGCTCGFASPSDFLAHSYQVGEVTNLDFQDYVH